jgi:hypothetical protein
MLAVLVIYREGYMSKQLRKQCATSAEQDATAGEPLHVMRFSLCK